MLPDLLQYQKSHRSFSDSWSPISTDANGKTALEWGKWLVA